MAITQTHKTEDNLHVCFSNPPFVLQEDLCSITDLPPELLSHVFETGNADRDDYVAFPAFGIRDDGDEEDTGHDVKASSHYPLPFPFLVSHVCRHWRNIAVSTPSLWTTIIVNAKARQPYDYEHQSTLLERSKNFPIDIYIDCQRDNPERDAGPRSDANLRFLLAMLIPHIHRWRTMQLAVWDYHLMYDFFNMVSDSSIVNSAASRLTTLQLLHCDGWKLEHGRFPLPSMSRHFTFLASVPLLARLVLWGVHVDWNQPWIVSASNLTHLELAFHGEDVRPSWAQFATMLHGASALETLELRASGPPRHLTEWNAESTLQISTAMDTSAPISLPRLRDLRLSSVPEALAIWLLRNVYLPALKRLMLDLRIDDYTNFVHELVRPTVSSSPSDGERRHGLLSRLDKLDIIELCCRTECIEMLYGELENLTSLALTFPYSARRFLDMICTPRALRGVGDVWLPRLASLRVDGADGVALREVVRKRRDAGVPLTALCVDRWSWVEQTDAEWLKENVKTFKALA